jgi:Dolichyl-phosphate-mannose-protein mannosyltransferase
VRNLLILVLLTAVNCTIILSNLRLGWTVIPWFIVIGIWAAYFWSGRVQKRQLFSSEPTPFAFGLLLLVLVAAAAVRLYRLGDFPLGANVDEIFTLNDSLSLLEKPFDPFGQTPLISEGWMEIPNLYLYFNLLILKVAGVSYWSMKLLSVIPGVIACGGIFLVSQLVFERRVAFWSTLLFAFAHWPIRLSRYGWVVSFIIMMFAIAIWLLLLALREGRPLLAYCSGIAIGLCMYSYVGSLTCLLALLAFLVLEGAYLRDRSILKQGIAFATGAATVGFPLFCYYVLKPAAFWVRARELSVFSTQHPLLVIFDNVWHHALMFHAIGGRFARDNFPGLPALDPITGILLIIGLIILIRQRNTTFARLIANAFVLNFAGGVFSISQEGPPYMYRTVAVVIPAFLIVGLAVQWLMRRSPRLLITMAILPSIILNLYLYFGLEARNTAAMRVMGYELRQIGQEIAQDNSPVFVVGADTLSPTELHARENETYAAANPAVVLSPVIQRLAVINFSGRYDMSKRVAENLAHPKNIYFVDSLPPGMTGPSKIIFRSHNHDIDQLLSKHQVSVRELRNIFGERLRTVATIS